MTENNKISDYFKREYETKNGKLLQINQLEIGDVGCVVWDASIVLAKYLEALIFDEKLCLGNKSFIELGAGTGLVGLVVAAYGANCTLTDLNDILPILHKNLNDNTQSIDQSLVKIKELDWNNHSFIQNTFEKYDIILIADCIYYEQSIDALIQCLIKLSKESTIIYCCYEERDIGKVPDVQLRFLKLIKLHFQVDKVSYDELDTDYRSQDIIVLKLRLK